MEYFILNAVGGTLETTDVTSHACPQPFLSCWVPAWLCGVTVLCPLCSAAACSLTPVAHPGHAASSCLHNVALALIPGCPAMDLGCREGLQCQVGPFSRAKGAGAAVGAAQLCLAGTQSFGELWVHRKKNSGEQSALFTGTENQNAAALELLEKFRRQQLFFLTQH